mgnify:CR=1 FL=1
MEILREPIPHLIYLVSLVILATILGSIIFERIFKISGRLTVVGILLIFSLLWTLCYFLGIDFYVSPSTGAVAEGPKVLSALLLINIFWSVVFVIPFVMNRVRKSARN